MLAHAQSVRQLWLCSLWEKRRKFASVELRPDEFKVAILTFAQVLITTSKLLCSIRQFKKKMSKFEKKMFFWKKNKKKIFCLKFFYRSSSAEDDLWKTTYGRRPGKKIYFPALLVLPQYCLCFGQQSYIELTQASGKCREVKLLVRSSSIGRLP